MFAFFICSWVVGVLYNSTTMMYLRARARAFVMHTAERILLIPNKKEIHTADIFSLFIRVGSNTSAVSFIHFCNLITH